jgi:hypothetical protein
VLAGGVAVAGGVALVGPALAGVGPAGAATASAELIARPGTSTPLGSGGSATPYGVVLPAGASCPGDTAHDGDHVYSYLVPKGASPTDVSFKTGIPSRWFGYIAEGAYYGAVNTAESTGQIVGLPTSFTWARLTASDLFPGGARTATWEGGIACADTHGVVTDYWNSEIRFTADASDPGGFTWVVVAQGQVAVTSSSNLGLWVGLGLLVVASGATAYALMLRRRARADRAGPDDASVEGGPGPGVDGTGGDHTGGDGTGDAATGDGANGDEVRSEIAGSVQR